MIYKIDREAHVPLYCQLKEIIQDMIEEGIWQEGDKIPSENELQDQFGVSRTTVRLALKELVTEGKLKKEQGRGTFVAKPKLEHPLPSLTSFTEDIKNKGLSPGAKLLSLERKAPTKKIAEKLDLNEGEESIYLKRLRAINDEAVGIHTAYLNPKLLRDKKFESFNYEENSLYKILQEEYKITIGEAMETIEASPADNYQSELLNIEVGFPVLLLERLTYTKNDIPLEFVKIIYRADKYKYAIRLQR